MENWDASEWDAEDLLDLAPCQGCGQQVPRRLAALGHRCDPEQLRVQLLARFHEELESGCFTRLLERWQETNVEARLRHEWLSWQAAGCPSWPEWERSRQRP
jgi:hypothetical protein